MIDVYSEQFGIVSVIHLSGMLTLETIMDAEEAWSEQMDNDPDVIAISFMNVAHIDSISINHLFKLSERAAARRMKLVLYGANDHIMNLFKLVKLDMVALLMTKQGFESEYIKGT